MKQTNKNLIDSKLPKNKYNYSELELLIKSLLYINSNLTKKELKEITKLNNYVLNKVLSNLLTKNEISTYANFEDLRGNIYYLTIREINTS
jgi:DNA-binding MarR family transcriptional regulator